MACLWVTNVDVQKGSVIAVHRHLNLSTPALVSRQRDSVDLGQALSGLVGSEIGVAKDACLQFDLLQPTLDRITDADDSYQLALLDDR